jgi:DNA-binding transcriptional MerR regulator
MRRELPGSTLAFEDTIPQGAETLMTALFAGGDLMLSQVSHISGLKPYVIQNWVARGFLPPPVNKKYSRRQLSRILIVHMLGGVLPLESIVSLLSYVNGHLDDVSDDTVDDGRLYMWLIECICAPPGGEEEALKRCLEEYQEPFPGAARRLEQVLRIMTTAYAAAEMKKKAQAMIDGLDER